MYEISAVQMKNGEYDMFKNGNFKVFNATVMLDSYL